MQRPVLLAVASLVAILVALDLAAGVRLPWWGPFVLYALLYSLAHGMLAHRAAAESEPPGLPSEDRDPVPTGHWPTSGPIGRLGQTGLVIVFSTTGMLSILNPWQFSEIVRQAVGNVRIRRRLSASAASAAAAVQIGAVEYHLPFAAAPEGEWFVYNGGVQRPHSHSWDILTQRYAYDFVVVDSELRRHRGPGTRPSEFYCHGLEVRAAAPGVVVSVQDGIRTAPLMGWGIADFTAKSFRGNNVVVRHAGDEFSLYAHLVPGTVAVRPGQEVGRGERIGECGHTGHSSEPHLHFHIQDRPDFFVSAGLARPFRGLAVDGVPRKLAWIRLGQRIRPLSPRGGSGDAESSTLDEETR